MFSCVGLATTHLSPETQSLSPAGVRGDLGHGGFPERIAEVDHDDGDAISSDDLGGAAVIKRNLKDSESWRISGAKSPNRPIRATTSVMDHRRRPPTLG